MRKLIPLGTAPIPGSDKSLTLYRSKDDFHINLTGGLELMSTRRHGSEDALGYLPCRRLADASAACVLIGGLGMGFTLAAVLTEVGEAAEVTVAELIPEVVEWNRGPLGDASGRPLDDPRVRIEIADVATLIGAAQATYDVIALDVDNGAEDFTTGDNSRLYSDAGIAAARAALRPGGVLAYWSADPDARFKARLAATGMKVEEHRVHAFGNKGTQNVIWLAT
ncbi:MAG: hypothetical protein H6981_11610 [Gammaproteobacteria bacterium]|nr:hypothetical protein [Gammaproteobacteria bacterium]MCP5137434.1 hypothetical protein [Gammaproteobacteria bacterium]